MSVENKINQPDAFTNPFVAMDFGEKNRPGNGRAVFGS